MSGWPGLFNNPQDSKALQALQAIHNACNGNAKAMELLQSIIEDSYDGDIRQLLGEDQLCRRRIGATFVG